MKVKAKFTCAGITPNPESHNKQVSFLPVYTGSKENESFAKFTPAGSLVLTIDDETKAADAFEAGKEYYVTLEPAE